MCIVSKCNYFHGELGYFSGVVRSLKVLLRRRGDFVLVTVYTILKQIYCNPLGIGQRDITF